MTELSTCHQDYAISLFTSSGESTGPVIPGGGAQTSHHPVAAERSPRNYTNVEVAKMSVRGTHNKGRKTSVEILPGSIQMWYVF